MQSGDSVSSSSPVITLRRSALAAVANRHPWIFSGALDNRPDPTLHGSIVRIAAPDGSVIATGSYSGHGNIAVRVFAFDDVQIDKTFLADRIRAADNRRHLASLGPGTTYSGYRVVFGESDGLPGIVIDRYGEVIVVSFSTAGADALRPTVVDCLVNLFSPAAIYERSEGPSRQEEHLGDNSALRHGELPEEVIFEEDGLAFSADVAGGQKTGFFLDQRLLRRQIARLAPGRKVADLFCYTGAAGIAALKAGAESVDFVDSSDRALELCCRHVERNVPNSAAVTYSKDDVFQWLGARGEREYDMIILDPPALVKSRRNIEAGRKGYHFLNRAALRLVKDGGLLASSSCSQYFSDDAMTKTLRRAAEQAGVILHVVARVNQPDDHPVSLSFPEAAYLKSYICQIEVRRE